MYKLRFLAFTFVLAVVFVTCGAPRASAEEAISVASSAASAILYEPRSGRVLFEQQAHIKRPMASTTKLMTALLAAEMLAPDAVITVSPQAVDVIGTRMGLAAGDTVTRDDLLEGLLLASGNDAANALALSMAPTIEAFAELMNARATVLNMQNTQFVTPSGLDASGHGSTAFDMALLAAAVLQNETTAAICRMKSAEITCGGCTTTIHNHNKLLSRYPDAIGMKTGYTSLAGRCLVSAAERDGVTLIAVTLDCRNDWEEHASLLDAGFSLLTAITPPIPALPALTVYGGDLSELPLSTTPVSLVIPAFDADAVETAVSLPPYVWAPVEKGTVVGTVTYRLHGDVLATADITAACSAIIPNRTTWFCRMRQLFACLLRETLT